MTTSIKSKKSGKLGSLACIAIALGCVNPGQSESAEAQSQSAPHDVLREVPGEAYPAVMQEQKNLARWHMRSQVVVAPWDADSQPLTWTTQPRDPAMALLDDSSRESLDLKTGVSDFVIDLGNVSRISRFSILNKGIEGTLELFAATALPEMDSRRWARLGPPIALSPDQRFPELQFPIQEARYVRLQFSVSNEGGAVESVFLGGDITLADSAPVLPPSEELYANPNEPMVEIDFATLPIGSRITHVSSGEALRAPTLIDEDHATAFTFFLEDGDSIFVIAYPDTYRFDRASLVMQSGKGTLEIYGFIDLPKEIAEADVTQFIEIPDAFFADRFPAGRLVIDEPSQNATIGLDGLEAQHMLIRWKGINNPTPHFIVYDFSAVGSIPERFAYHVVTLPFEFADPDIEPPNTATVPAEPPRLPSASE